MLMLQQVWHVSQTLQDVQGVEHVCLYSLDRLPSAVIMRLQMVFDFFFCRLGTLQGTPTQSIQETSPGSLKCMATPTPALLLMSGTRWTLAPCCTQPTSLPVST